MIEMLTTARAALERYHDVQVEQRVSRRFETYGVSNRAGMGDSYNPMYADGDPMVRGRASEVYFQAVLSCDFAPIH